MNFIERVMRVMTHVNIGAALGLMAWVMWSGWQVVTGQIAPAVSPSEVRAAMSVSHTVHPVQAARTTLPPCHEMPAEPVGGVALRSGADL